MLENITSYQGHMNVITQILSFLSESVAYDC